MTNKPSQESRKTRGKGGSGILAICNAKIDKCKLGEHNEEAFAIFMQVIFANFNNFQRLPTKTRRNSLRKSRSNHFFLQSGLIVHKTFLTLRKLASANPKVN